MWMRGYFGFLLVLYATLLLLALAGAAGAARDFSLSRAIAAERMYQAQMNAKEAVMEAVRQGAADGFADYSAGHSRAACLAGPLFTSNPDCFRDTEASLQAKAWACSRLANLSFSSPDIEISLWYGIAGTGARVGGEAFPACLAAVSIELAPGTGPQSGNPSLSSIKIGDAAHTTIGFSLHSERLGAGAVSYIPAGKEVGP